MAKMLRITTLVFVLLTLLPACSSSKEQADFKQPETTIRVRNNNWLDMTVYVVRETLRHRLGFVSTGQTKIFVIPEHFVTGAASLRFVADPLGSASIAISHDFPVVAGDEIDLIIPNN